MNEWKKTTTIECSVEQQALISNAAKQVQQLIIKKNHYER